ncbi:MAG TPA: hypothetical protein VK487_03985 [Candidatus Bathyarchaeia archaeon]|nr:hypothetical protein [Candidatus Bathyarchaeia archaeon]
MSAEPLWRRPRGNAEFRKDLIRAQRETFDLEGMLRKNLMSAKKEKIALGQLPRASVPFSMIFL